MDIAGATADPTTGLIPIGVGDQAFTSALAAIAITFTTGTIDAGTESTPREARSSGLADLQKVKPASETTLLLAGGLPGLNGSMSPPHRYPDIVAEASAGTIDLTGHVRG